MLQFFDAVRDEKGVDTAADDFSVAVTVINIRCVEVNDDNAADDVNSNADNCDGNGAMANDVDVVVVEFVFDNDDDNETRVNVINDVLSDMNSNADNAVEDASASADADGIADVEIAVKTSAVVETVTCDNCEYDAISADCNPDPEPESELKSESEPEPEPGPEPRPEPRPEPEPEPEPGPELEPCLRRFWRRRL